jgi:hypothetical protein
MVEKSLANNAKIVIPADSELVNVIGDLAGVLPLTNKTPKEGPAAQARGRAPAPPA